MALEGRYAIRKKIADGGMAEIFLATAQGAEGFERPVILKRILPTLSADPTFRRLIVDEAHVAMSLIHGNVVQVMDLGRVGDQYFLVMELVEGWDLASLIARGEAASLPMPLGLACHVIAEVCRGLAYAHGKKRGGEALRIVHRDICPQNILVSVEGEVKITDFGIARALDAAGGSGSRGTAGVVAGHVSFMSPEQASAGALDARSDVFSAGAVLYLLVTGQAPIEGDSLVEALTFAQAGKLVPPEVVRPDLPASVARIVRRATAPKLQDRYPTAAAMMAELEAALRTELGAPGQSELAEWLASLSARDGARPISDGPGVPEVGPALPVTEDRTIVLDPIERQIEELVAAPRALRAPGIDTTLVDAPAAAPAPLPPPLTSVSPPARRRGKLGLVLLGLGALVVYGSPELRARAVDAWDGIVARVSAPRERTTAKSTVRVVSEPAGALVERGSERLGTTPFVLTARVGSTHRLAFSMPGYASTTREVTVEPEASTTIVILKPVAQR